MIAYGNIKLRTREYCERFLHIFKIVTKEVEDTLFPFSYTYADLEGEHIPLQVSMYTYCI